ncbi:MAG: OsmC family peroxiredoxin [Sphingomonas sp.]|nr:MAG: OsmC family peroxiredoxin [Sphingomonas sp.]
MRITRSGSVTWTGGLKDGKGAISTPSGALSGYPYGFASRFEGQAGSNPEELLAAAHAACFTMSLTVALERAGFPATSLSSEAKVHLEFADGAYSIPSIELTVDAVVPGIGQAQFEEIAHLAERNCPVSKLFKADITLTPRLA